jgi:hypothetical protein
MKNFPHVVIIDTGTAVALAGEATGTILDVLVDDMDCVHVLRRDIVHSVQKRPGDMQGVAQFSFGASV